MGNNSNFTFTKIIVGEKAEINQKDELLRPLEEAINEGKRHILLDVSSISYLRSSSIGKIVSHHQSVKKMGGALCMVNVSNTLNNLLIELKLDKVLNLFTTEEECLIEYNAWEGNTELTNEDDMEFNYKKNISPNGVQFILTGMFNVLSSKNTFAKDLYNTAETADKITLDLSNLLLIDSTGLGAFLKAAGKFKKRDKKIILKSPSSLVADLLNDLDADEWFTIIK